ncbi:MAG: phosphatidate cytidylyltransferase [Acidobacteriota bacterium]|nr:phosphatidate cytidylyltransferase [Acidobacteriota bacterium]
MRTRVLTGAAIVVPAFYLLGWSPKWLFLLVMIVIVERGLYEYILIAQKSGIDFLAAAGYAGGAALCVLQWAALRYSEVIEFAGLIALLVLIPSVSLWRVRELKRYLACSAATTFGIYYVAFGLSCLFPLRFGGLGSGLADGRDIVFFLFIVVSGGDIFAYFTGRLFGHRPMFHRVSPKKTMEGSLGGLIASLVLGWAYAQWFWRTKDTAVILVLALVVAIAGQIGDLAESAMKRGADMKDSGALLPGHGGLLDRVDSLLFGAPVLWLALELRNLIH